MPVDVVFRARRRFVLRPGPDGRVTVSAPRSMGRRAVLAWLEGEGAAVLASVARRLPSGEELELRRAWGRLREGDVVAVWGRPVTVRLEPTGRRPAARLDGDTLALAVPDPDDPSEEARQLRRRLFEGLLRSELAAAVPGARERAERAVGVGTGRWTVRRMRSRWGSCRPSTGSVSLSLDLACHDPAFLDLVAVHEVAHMEAPDHGPRFSGVMDRALPGWRGLQADLDREGMRLPADAPAKAGVRG